MALFLVWWGTLFLLSSMSPPEMPEMPVTVNDKVAHAVYFFAGGFLFAAAIRGRGAPGVGHRDALIAAGALFVIGAIDELYQLLTPGRSGADPFDWLADCLGAALGAWFAWWYFKPFWSDWKGGV